MSIAPSQWHARDVSEAARAWPIRGVLAASIALALALATFLAARRLDGAASSPLPPWQLATTAMLLVCWSVAVRTFFNHPATTGLIGLALALFAIGLSFPGERAIDWLIWLTAGGVYLAAHNLVEFAPARRTAPALTPRDSECILQQFTRTKSADGHECIHGTLLAEFASGQRNTTLYAAFCPPFERLPQVELESTADARLIQTLHNGIQIEVRLPRAETTTTSATVEFYASEPDGESAA